MITPFNLPWFILIALSYTLPFIIAKNLKEKVEKKSSSSSNGSPLSQLLFGFFISIFCPLILISLLFSGKNCRFSHVTRCYGLAS